MASGRLIDYLGEGLFSARPVAPDLAVGALGLYYATDTNTLYAWDGSAWDTVGGGSSGQPITATTGESGTTLTALPAAAWNYTRFTNAGTKTYTFDSAQAYVTNTEFHGRNVGAGDLTIAQAGSFVITPPVGGSLVIPQGQSFFLKITGTNTADLILQSPSGTGPPPGSPAVFLDNTPSTNASGTTHNITYPATVAAGDLIIAVAAGSSAVGTYTLDPAWTSLGVVTGYVVAYRIATGTEGGTTVPLFTVTTAVSSTCAMYRIQTGTFDPVNPLSAALVSTGAPHQLPVPTPPTGGWNSTAVLFLGVVMNVSAITTTAYPFPDNRQATTSSRIMCFSTIVRDPAIMWEVGIGTSTSVTFRKVMIGVNPV